MVQVINLFNDIPNLRKRKVVLAAFPMDLEDPNLKDIIKDLDIKDSKFIIPHPGNNPEKKQIVSDYISRLYKNKSIEGSYLFQLRLVPWSEVQLV